jgi:hypothetical protein
VWVLEMKTKDPGPKPSRPAPKSSLRVWAIVNRGRIMSVSQDYTLELYRAYGDAARALKYIKQLAWVKGTPKIVPVEVTIKK